MIPPIMVVDVRGAFVHCWFVSSLYLPSAVTLLQFIDAHGRYTFKSLVMTKVFV